MCDTSCSGSYRSEAREVCRTTERLSRPEISSYNKENDNEKVEMVAGATGSIWARPGPQISIFLGLILELYGSRGGTYLGSQTVIQPESSVSYHVITSEELLLYIPQRPSNFSFGGGILLSDKPRANTRRPFFPLFPIISPAGSFSVVRFTHRINPANYLPTRY